MIRPPGSRAGRWLLLVVVLAAVALAAVLALTRGRPVAEAPQAGGGSSAASVVEGAPKPSKPVVMEGLDEVPVAMLRLAVYEPAKVRAALRANGWVQQLSKEPLGVGFAAGWAGFLGTRGEDVQGVFAGTVLDLVLDRVLTEPFELVWFGGERSSSTPALILPDEGGAGEGFDLLDRIAHSGTIEVLECLAPKDAPSEGARPKAQIAISRWMLAEHALFAGRRGDRLVLGSHPTAVLQGLCAELTKVARPDETDLELLLAPEALGREAQSLAQLLGGASAPRLQFAVAGERLVPRGLAAKLAASGRLDAGPLPDDLLRLVPESTSVLLTAQLRLPARLDASSLRAHFEGKSAGLLTRQVALVWQPRGDAKAPTEIGLVWSRPEDAEDLRALFSGPNRPLVETVCGKPVVASTKDVAARLAHSCAGRVPSILHAPPAVLAGLRARSSIGLGVRLGSMLSQLTEDGWRTSAAAKGAKAVPPEIRAAQRRLEELPFLGLFGTVDDDALVPGGFRS